MPKNPQEFAEVLGRIRENLPEMKELDLNDYGLTAEDAQQLVLALGQNTTITTLTLRENRIGAEGARALAGNTTITTLNLDSNKIGDEGARALAGNTTITTLNLDSNKIGDEGARVLAGNTTITTLSLSWNEIGAEGARALAGNTTITTLDLSWNEIGAEGARALAGNTTITTLNLSWNEIGDEGVRALVRNTTITTLDLYNDILIEEMLRRNREKAAQAVKLAVPAPAPAATPSAAAPPPRAVALSQPKLKDSGEYFERAKEYKAEKKYELAVADLNTVIREKVKEPQSDDLPLAYFELGLLSNLLDDSASALLHFSQAILLMNMNYAQAYFERGKIHRSIGNEALAQKDFKRALACKADYAEAQRALAAVSAVTRLSDAVATIDQNFSDIPSHRP